ncbi:MAG: CHAT domain-containing protein [Limnoraphis sp. WC205]|nr:CHAT domain-containing protein [Limnoraphis sp. WC205]
MSRSDSPCLSLAIARLSTREANHFATWVVQSPYPSGYVHHDCILPETLSQAWQAWLEMFSPQSLAQISPLSFPQPMIPLASTDSSQKLSYSSRLMQHLGINLWQWLFQGAIQTSLHRSQGIAIGQDQPLRVRLDVREADLIPLPWEIMQPQAGQPAISLSQQLLFSRTTSDVNPLPQYQPAQLLNILLVLGQPEAESKNSPGLQPLEKSSQIQQLQLEQEAQQLSQIFTTCSSPTEDPYPDNPAPCRVTTLIQPSISQLIAQLETGEHNVLFYGGHCIPAPDGGLLFLQPDVTLNGTELAQVLVRCGVVMAVFNACWGAHPAFDLTPSPEAIFQAIPSSSLAKVLIHHGVPAVLGMRDSITDQEALSFIQAFAQALVARKPIDQAVAIARQHLLTLYKFNQPAWTLPVLYMHPEFSGELMQPLEEIRTELPVNSPTWLGYVSPRAWLRLPSRLDNGETVAPQIWPIEAGSVRVGRGEDNDIVISEQWVSSKHAEIFSRNSNDDRSQPSFFLRDFSRYGTLVLAETGWQRVHHQEVALQSGTQLKFGSSQGQALEFMIDPAQPSI